MNGGAACTFRCSLRPAPQLVQMRFTFVAGVPLSPAEDALLPCAPRCGSGRAERQHCLASWYKAQRPRYLIASQRQARAEWAELACRRPAVPGHRRLLLTALLNSEFDLCKMLHRWLC